MQTDLRTISIPLIQKVSTFKDIHDKELPSDTLLELSKVMKNLMTN